MGKLKKLIVLVVVVAIVYLIFGNLGFRFDFGYNAVKDIYEKHGLGVENFSAATIEENSEILQELDESFGTLQFEVFSNDADALRLFLMSKIYYLKAANNMYEVDEIVQTFYGARPSCNEGEEIWLAANLLDGAKENLGLANEAVTELVEKYPAYAEKVGIADIEEYTAIVSGMQENATITAVELETFCVD